MSSTTTATKFCFLFFTRNGLGKCEGMEEGKCPYSHDMDKYMTEKGLKICPKCTISWCKETSKICSKCVSAWLMEKETVKEQPTLKDCPQGCVNLCKETSKACSVCVSGWIKEREEREKKHAEFMEQPEQLCSGVNCPNMTRYSFCKSCSEINKIYVVKRH